MVILKTPRLLVRDPRSSDLDSWHRLLSDEVNMYYLQDILTRSPEESLENLTVAIEESQSSNRTKYFFAIEHSRTGSLIGSIGYTVTEFTPFGNLVELGYFSLPEYHGQGFMSEALGAVLRFAFEENNVYRLSTGCFANNRASQRVMEKCGLIKEAEFKSAIWHDRALKDRLEYRLLLDEWNQEKNRQNYE